MSIEKYLDMQRKAYNKRAPDWSLKNKDPVVGSYEQHNAWKDYDEFLFKGIDTTDLVALDYGTGPGRNIIKFWDQFKRIDGVDIGKGNIKNAKLNLCDAGIIEENTLCVCDGNSIPFAFETYDIVFSTICLQHICSYDIRFNILQDAYRVLKPSGHLCLQMGYDKPDTKFPNRSVATYYENIYDALKTNGRHDVTISDPNNIKNDLINKIGFKTFEYNIRQAGPGDFHANWIFVRAQK